MHLCCGPPRCAARELEAIIILIVCYNIVSSLPLVNYYYICCNMYSAYIRSSSLIPHYAFQCHKKSTHPSLLSSLSPHFVASPYRSSQSLVFLPAAHRHPRIYASHSFVSWFGGLWPWDAADVMVTSRVRRSCGRCCWLRWEKTRAWTTLVGEARRGERAVNVQWWYNLRMKALVVITGD